MALLAHYVRGVVIWRKRSCPRAACRPTEWGAKNAGHGFTHARPVDKVASTQHGRPR